MKRDEYFNPRRIDRAVAAIEDWQRALAKAERAGDIYMTEKLHVWIADRERLLADAEG